MVYLFLILIVLVLFLVLLYFNGGSLSLMENLDINSCSSCAVTNVLPNMFPRETSLTSVSPGYPIGNYSLFTETSNPKPDVSRQEKVLLTRRLY